LPLRYDTCFDPLTVREAMWWYCNIAR